MDFSNTEPGSSDRLGLPLFIGCFSLEQFLAYVDHHLESKLSLETVSKHVRLSKVGFTKRFLYLVGKPFHQYLIHRRVEKAETLLVHTDLDIAVIADEMGFSSPSHFISVFRRKTGSTPTRAREMQRADSDLRHRAGAKASVISASIGPFSESLPPFLGLRHRDSPHSFIIVP